MAQPFNDKRLELVGKATPVAEKVGSFFQYGLFSASTNGLLVYRSGDVSQFSQNAWFDREGKLLGAAEEAGMFFGLALSRDGLKAVFSRIDATSMADVWLLDLSQSRATRSTFGQSWNYYPIWSPDGTRIIFASNRDGNIYNLYQKPASGAKNEELLLKTNEDKTPNCWSSDGRFVLYTARNEKTKNDLWVLALDGDIKQKRILGTTYNELDGRFSPNMKWIAYVSDESGSYEIWVREFSPIAGTESSEANDSWVISKGGGIGPRWSAEGNELYYRDADGYIVAVEIKDAPGFKLGKTTRLFQAPPDLSTGLSSSASCYWDVTGDGRRFLLPTPATEASPTPFAVILNWTASLKK